MDRFFQRGREVLHFAVTNPLEAVGDSRFSALEVSICACSRGVDLDDDPTVDLLSLEELEALVQGHLDQGYQECDRFGRPMAPIVSQIPPPLQLREIPAALPASPVPAPHEPDQAGHGPVPTQEHPVAKSSEKLLSLAEYLQRIRELMSGWDSLSREEQRLNRNQIYAFRTLARKAAKAEGLGDPDLPPIPKLREEDGPEEDEVERTLEEVEEEDEAPITLASVKDSVADLTRQVWLIMADIAVLSPAERGDVAGVMDSLARATSCAAQSLQGGRG